MRNCYQIAALDLRFKLIYNMALNNEAFKQILYNTVQLCNDKLTSSDNQT